MKRDELGDLMAFLVVCEERSFTRAAARLGTSQSSLSHTIRRLEERLDLRLLTRTTRNVAPTHAGEELAATLRPAFDDITNRLASLNELRAKPAGLVRLNAARSTALNILWPRLSPVLAEHPDIKLEITVDQKMTDIIEERYDAGIRLGDDVEKDMIAVRIGPDIHMQVYAAPSYLAAHGTPQTPNELTSHNCINLRLPTLGGLYPWEFEKDGRPLNVRVEGQLTTNEPDIIIQACVEGRGLSCMPDDLMNPLVAEGRLVPVLSDYAAKFAGLHIYYPSRRQATPAFQVVLEALRYRA